MKTIEQTITFEAPPAEIYEALLDPEKHAAFTGEPAAIRREVGGEASFYGGKVTAIVLHLAKDACIVQAWRPANFPAGVFTLVTYALSPDGRGTKLAFTQSAVPDEAYEHLSKGWDDRYWKPLRAYLAKSKR